MKNAFRSTVVLDFLSAYAAGMVPDEDVRSLLIDCGSRASGGWIETPVGTLPREDVGRHSRLALVEGKPLYILKDAIRSKNRVVWGAHSSPWYDHIEEGPDVVDGNVAYLALRNDGKRIAVWGNEKSRPFGGINFFSVAEGKMLYSATYHKEDPSDEFIVWGDTRSQTYKGIASLAYVGGALLFVADAELTHNPSYVVWGDIVSRRFDWVGDCDVTVVKGKPLFVGYRDDIPHIVWGDMETKCADGYDTAKMPHVTDDGFTYAASVTEGPRKYATVVWNGVEGAFCDEVRDLVVVGSRPLYSAWETSEDGSTKWCTVVWGTRENGSYEDVHSIRSAEDVPLYCAMRDGEWFVVWGKEEGQGYDEVFSLEVKDGLISYGARKGRRIYRVTRKIEGK